MPVIRLIEAKIYIGKNESFEGLGTTLEQRWACVAVMDSQATKRLFLGPWEGHAHVSDPV